MRFCTLFLTMTLGVAPAMALAAPVQPAPTPAPAPVSGTRSPAEQFAAADGSGGYSGLVLQQVLPHWQPPAGTNGMARVLVRVSAQGRVLSCEPLRSQLDSPRPAASGAEAIPGTSATVSALAAPPPPVPPQDRVLADLACEAVAAAGQFATPPYGLIAEVSLILSAGNVRGEQAARPKDYADLVLERVQPHIVVPVGLTGEYTVQVNLRVRGDGSLEGVTVVRPSGRKDVDAAILQALTTPGVVPPPPNEGGGDLLLTYTLRGK